MADSQRKAANLFDKDNAVLVNGYPNAQDTIASSPNTRMTYIECKPNTTYTVSRLAGKRFIISYSEQLPDIGVQVYGSVFGNEESSLTITTGNTARYLTVYFYHASYDTETVQTFLDSMMINTGSTPLPYEPYGWLHSLRKLGTATDTITTLPQPLYADGNSATVGLQGNMTQTGTPTPENPITPQETGDRTENLCPVKSFNKTTDRYYTISFSQPLTAGTYTISAIITPSTGVTESRLSFRKSDTSQDIATNITIQDGVSTVTVTLLSDCYSLYIYGSSSSAEIVSIAYDNLMIIAGSTAPSSYIPYGYKIPILSGNTTTPVYLGEVQTTRKIKKLVLTGDEETWSQHATLTSWFMLNINTLETNTIVSNVEICSHYKPSTGTPASIANGEILVNYQDGDKRIIIRDTSYSLLDDFKAFLQQQYAAGTPVCVWYVLATPTTGIVNEPLRKIGEYADSITGVTIPTLSTADTFDILTTLKPSEVSLSYTGWHDASVKEWDGSEWQ